MNDERQRILTMVAEGKLSVDEAEKLLAAVERQTSEKTDLSSEISRLTEGKFLYVIVNPKEGKSQDKVSVKVPFALLKAGLNIAGLIPKEAQEKIQSSMNEHGMSFDLNEINPKNIQEILTALEELTVDVDTEESTVQVFCR